MSSTTRTLVSALVGAVSVAAHGHVNNIVVNGVSYAGYDVTKLPYMSDPPVVVGWSSEATDNGFVAPDAFSDPDIICHKGALNAKGHAQVAAGDSIYIQWDTWPESHHGPVLDYLASCGTSGCESVDKEALKFFKIDEVGLVDGSAAPGQYGADELIANGNGWLVEIPSSIKPGFYVLRHEIIALHSAGQENGAQNYPQCFNLEITGSGTEQPEGTLGTELYKADDEGILFNIYTTLSDYPVPGPTVIAGASAVSQSSSAISSTGEPTTGTAQATGGSGATSAAATSVAATSAAATTVAATEEAPSSAAATEPAVTSVAVSSAPAPTSVAATSVAVPTSTQAAAQPSATTGSGSGCSSKKRRSRKVRRHVRDVRSRNVAPVRA
ncbi:Fc.00g114570.m01.CDS01 [Cosmosporella sp. VM-42]